MTGATPYDSIIIGSGIAGLYTALLAQEQGRVLLLTKGSLDECNTKYAQGGIAAAIGALDSPELHLQDTLAGVLIKDNHLAILRSHGGDLREAIARARRGVPFTIKIEVEATTVEEARAAAEAGADLILLDNMPVDEMREAVRSIRAMPTGEQGRPLVEASGGITLEKVRAIAETGVDFLSSGALTHSFRALDISLEMEV